jgi:hypothetical protein
MTGTRRRVTPVRLAEPRTIAISAEDYQQAVTALAAMIQQWWQHNEQHAVRSSAAVPGLEQPDPGGMRTTARQTLRRRTAVMVTSGP